MTNSKLTKRSLLASSISLLLCFTMLLGTTFAWFTDSATSVGNKIMAGNLNVELYMHDGTDYVNISENKDPIFGSYGSSVAQNVNIDTLWEPGKTQVAYLKIANEGNLALKYQVALNTINPADGKDLYKVMQYQIAPDAQPLSATWTAGAGINVTPGTAIVADEYVPMQPNDAHYFALLVHMDENAGNDYMNGKVEFDISVIATQLNAESDSFGTDYDKNAIVADEYVSTEEALIDALENAEEGASIGLTSDIEIPVATQSNAYGATGINILNGQTLDGGNNTFGVSGANSTWDSAINITSGTIKNITINEGFRGIFINHNGTGGLVTLENVIIDGPTYTISCDQGTRNGLVAVNSVFNGWTSYAATIGNVEFTKCKFGEGAGYAFCRPYAPTAFVGCEFEAGFELDARAAVTFENCTLDGVALTDANLATLVTGNIANATIK